MEASINKIGNRVEQLILYCYHYNPASGKYGLAIMNVVRLGGVATLIGLAAMFLFFRRYNGNKSGEAT